MAIAATAELAACHILVADPPCRRRTMRLALNVRLEELLMVLKDSEDLPALASVHV